MGQEVVYCHKCLTRLVGSDFDSGKAYRIGDQFTCASCTQVILTALPEAERHDLQQRLLADRERRGSSSRHAAVRVPGSGSSGSIPVPPAKSSAGNRSSSYAIRVPGQHSSQSIPVAEPRKGRALPVLAVVGAAGLALAVVVAFATSDREGSTSNPPPAGPPPRPDSSEHEAKAKGALDRARAAVAANPTDVAAHVSTWEKAVWEAGDSTSLAEAKRELEGARTRLAQLYAPEVDALFDRARAMADREDFAGAADLLTQARKRRETPIWSTAIDRKIQELRDLASVRFKPLKEQAIAAQRRGAASEVKALRERVAKWNYRSLIEELDKALAETVAAAPSRPNPQPPKPAPVKPPDAGRPLSKEGQSYRARWEKAMLLAAARRFDETIAELQRASLELREADVKAEAQADLKAAELAQSATAQALKALSEWSRYSILAVEVMDDSGKRKTVNDRVVRVDAHRAELRKARSNETVIVDFGDIAGTSLADLLAKRQKSPNEESRRAWALLCLLDGRKDAALGHLGGTSEKIPWKYWELSDVARSRTPRPDPREREAQRLFNAAEREYRAAGTRGAAIEKYRTLRDSFAETACVRRYQTLVVGRSEEGKEFVIGADEIRGSGGFRPVPYGEDRVWLSTAEPVGDAAARENYVEFDFHASPGTAYRCWVYAGGCCQETFTAYFQATELTGPNPRKAGETIPYEPGGNVALPLKYGPSSLRKTHALHAPANEAKEPKKWDWVSVPLPKFSTPGAKRVRLLSDQKGFAVACAVVSSVRKDGPAEAETRALLRAKPAASPETTRPCRQPVEWLVVGPFDGSKNRGIATVHPPEQEFDPGAMFTTKAGTATWTPTFAEMRPNGAAVIGLASLLKPKENVVAYAVIHVKSPAERDAKLLTGSDDGAKIWVNGKLVQEKATARGLKVDEDQIPIRLKAGWNRFLFKVYQGTGDWAMSMRLVGTDGKPLTNLEYDALGDLPRP